MSSDARTRSTNGAAAFFGADLGRHPRKQPRSSMPTATRSWRAARSGSSPSPAPPSGRGEGWPIQQLRSQVGHPSQRSVVTLSYKQR